MEPLDTIESQFRLNINQKKDLEKNRARNYPRFAFYFPTRYGDITELKNIKDLETGDKSIIYAKVKSIRTSKAYIKKYL